MRLTFALVLLLTFHLSANVYSQQTKLSLNLTNVTIREVLDQIEQRSNFKFLIQDERLDLNQRIDLNLEQRNITEVLNNVFAGQDVHYVITEKNLIIITPGNGEIFDKGAVIQGKTISGKVTDSSGSPLPGVSVIVKGTTIGSITDSEGNYSLKNIPGNAILVFSFIGMRMQEVSVDGKSIINISLQEETVGLEEVVAVGYGTMKKVNLTGAISTVNVEKLENRPITDASQALQGVSGLYVNQAGGQPGKDEATIRIRGLGTLNDNSPLVLINGIEGSLSDINPNDIESISVLKDAASASIYGNRAANGVILVKTKDGAKNVSKIEYNCSFGIQNVTCLPDLLKDPVEFMKWRNQAQENAGKTTHDYSDDLIEEYDKGRYTDPYTYPQNDWLDIMFDPAFMQEHNLRVSGGNESMNYAVSAGYLEQNGVLMGTNSNKFTFHSNLNFQVNKAVKIGTDLAITQRYIHEPATTAASMMEMVFKAQGFHPTYLEDGRYANTFIKTSGHNVYRHPLVWANEGYWKDKPLRAILSVYTDIKLPGGLTYSAKVAVNKLDEFKKQFVPEIYMYQVKTLEASKVDYYTDDKNRHVTNEDYEETNLTLYHTLKWESSFQNKHKLTALIGSSYESFYDRNFTATIEGLLSNDLSEIDAGSTNKETSGTSSKNVLIGAFGRLNYSFDQKYLCEVNFRYDGSSKFAKGSRWGFFPSFSLGWRLEQEEFMKDLDWISGLKLRLSYGSLGNERIGNYKYVNKVDVGYGYSFGGDENSGTAVTAYNDPNISWETTTIGNIGIDATLFRDKLNFTAEFYRKRTNDILRQVDLAALVGNLSGPFKNIGKVDNKGIELTIGYHNSIRDFTYQIDAGINYNVNKVVELNGEAIIDGKFITEKGHPIDSYYILQSDGIFQTQDEIDSSPYQNTTTKPGYLKYKDQNDDKKIDSGDRIITGQTTPKYTFQFSLNFGYKNWSLASFFNGVYGIDTYPEKIVAFPFWFGTSVTKRWLTDSWTPERRDARLPILTCFEDSENDNYRESDFWVQDASYLRLKNLQLGYSVPKQLIHKIGLSKLLLFINGQNLLTFTKMKDFDPERNIQQGNYYEYPSTKIYSAGLNVTF